MEDYTRTEQYLNGILNGTPVPEPYTREEKLLAEIAKKETNAGAVPYDNTTSGLTATNVQAAIDEVAQGGGGGGGGGGAEDFVVEFTITPGETFVVTSETTFAQIYAAYQQGKNIKGVSELTGLGDVMLQLAHISDTLVVFFTFIEMIAGDGMYMTVRGTSSGYTAYPYH